MILCVYARCTTIADDVTRSLFKLITRACWARSFLKYYFFIRSRRRRRRRRKYFFFPLTAGLSSFIICYARVVPYTIIIVAIVGGGCLNCHYIRAYIISNYVIIILCFLCPRECLAVVNCNRSQTEPIN